MSRKIGETWGTPFFLVANFIPIYGSTLYSAVIPVSMCSST
jgi:hypothetical protein